MDPFDEYEDEAVWKALKAVQLSSHVSTFDNGLLEEIKQDGDNLSFGQRQLISIARMVLRQPPLLLLDEATSAIDPRTQEGVQRTIHQAFAASTIVAVAHRLETIMDFDAVCVLDR